jgi:dUTPase
MSSELKYTYAEGFEPFVTCLGETIHPARKTEGSAGIDIPIPKHTKAFLGLLRELNEEESYEIETDARGKNPVIALSGNSKITIPTGLIFDIPARTYLDVANRGSVSAKLGLLRGAHVIDEDYIGIVFINLFNLNSHTVRLTEGMNIAQLIHKTYIPSIPTFISPSEFKKATIRGIGNLGSTGS